jgi:hypothetical protein
MAGKKGTAVARKGAGSVPAPAVRRAAREVTQQLEAGEGLGMEMMLPNGKIVNMRFSG